MMTVALLLLAYAVLIWFFPRSLTYPLIVLLVWVALALVYRSVRLLGQTRPKQRRIEQQESKKSPSELELKLSDDRQVIRRDE